MLAHVDIVVVLFWWWFVVMVCWLLLDYTATVTPLLFFEFPTVTGYTVLALGMASRRGMGLIASPPGPEVGRRVAGMSRWLVPARYRGTDGVPRT